MKNLFTIVLGLLLAVSLAFYGSVGLAKTSGSAAFSMVICSDGVSKIMSFDAAGNPVEPAQTCPECLACCPIVGDLSPVFFATLPSFTLLEIGGVRPLAQDPFINTRHILPAPRGPPAAPFSKPQLTAFEGWAGGQMTRCDGRPLLEDANA